MRSPYGRRNPKNKRDYKRKFPNPPCDDTMKFQDCELAILRQAIDEIENSSKKDIVNSEEVRKMIEIVEEFIKNKKSICYGGTAINNILPKEVQFYDRDIEIPDYDFYSTNPIEDAKELSDIFYQNGYADVEAKSGVHYGTYKVYVNFIPMADITLLHKDLFESLAKDSIEIDGILYAPPNFLRMGMFLELSRPNGDVSRWEKVLKRLTLLNKYHPLKVDQCSSIDFQRSMESSSEENSSKLYYIVRDSFLKQKVIFFGGYASSLYARYMPYERRRMLKTIPDFDVLCENAELCATMVEQKLKDEGYDGAKIMKHEAIGEVVPEHYEILVDDETLAFVYEPIGCHNYNEIHIEGNKIRVATIDTILSFYLAFLYTDHSYYSQYRDRLLCMCKFLFDVEQNNRLSQQGLLKRFSLSCYGTQPTLESIRAEKSEAFRRLKKKRNGKEWDSWFLKYNPSEKSAEKKNGKTKKETIAKEEETSKSAISKSATSKSATSKSATNKTAKQISILSSSKSEKRIRKPKKQNKKKSLKKKLRFSKINNEYLY